MRCRRLRDEQDPRACWMLMLAKKNHHGTENMPQTRRLTHEYARVRQGGKPPAVQVQHGDMRCRVAFPLCYWGNGGPLDLANSSAVKNKGAQHDQGRHYVWPLLSMLERQRVSAPPHTRAGDAQMRLTVGAIPGSRSTNGTVLPMDRMRQSLWVPEEPSKQGGVLERARACPYMQFNTEVGRRRQTPCLLSGQAANLAMPLMFSAQMSLIKYLTGTCGALSS